MELSKASVNSSGGRGRRRIGEVNGSVKSMSESKVVIIAGVLWCRRKER